MKILIVCQEPFPYGRAATRRITCYAKALIQEGLDCRVLIYKRTEKDLSRNPATEGEYEAVPFKYSGPSTIKPRHKFHRIFAEYADKVALLSYLKKNLQSDDIVLAYVNSDFHFIRRLIDLVHFKEAKIIRELCEIPYFGNDSDAKNRILTRLFPKYDAFLAISSSLYDVALRYKNDDAKVLKLPILVDQTKIGVNGRPDCEDIPFIFHSGTLLEQKDGILGLIEAFALARGKYGKDMRLVCTGMPVDSPDYKRIIETIERYQISDYISFVGYITDEQVYDYLARAALVVINKLDNEQNRFCFSTKLGEYLSSGKAVITTDVGESMNWLENGKNAVIVHEGDVSALSDAIVTVLSDSDLRKRLGECGRALCCNSFDYKVVAPAFAEFVKSI